MYVWSTFDLAAPSPPGFTFLKANEKFLVRDGCESVKVLQPITAEHSSQNTE